MESMMSLKTTLVITTIKGQTCPPIHCPRCFNTLEEMVAFSCGFIGRQSRFKLVDNNNNPIPFVPQQPEYHLLEEAEAQTPGRVPSATRDDPTVVFAKAANHAFFNSIFIESSEYNVSASQVVSYLSSASKHCSAASIGALTQSSGWGKSRLMREICETHKMPYISFDERGSVPGASAFAKNVLKCVFDTNRVKGISSEKLVQEVQYCLASFLEDIIEHAVALDGKEFFALFFNEASTSRLEFMANSEEALECAVKKYCETFGVEYVLLLIDEAAWLLEESRFCSDGISPFRIVRRALKIHDITALFASTNSAVQNFLPALHKENSSSWKTGELEPCDLPQGICNVGPLDVTINRDGLDSLPLPAIFDVERLSRYGRPLWHALLKSSCLIGQSPSLREMVHYAYKKMDMETSTEGHMACVLSLIGLAGLTPGRLAETLVKSHMATLRGISSDRISVYFTYITEPFIHLAALRCLERSPSTFSKIMITFRTAMTSGMVNIGYSGEVVARLMLLMPRARAPGLTLMSDYVKSLIGLEMESGFSEYLSFTHWINWEGSLSQQLLFDAFIRTAAIVTGRNEKAVDLVIPIARVEADGLVRVSQMKALFVQVKNRTKHCSAKPIFTAMDIHLAGFRDTNSYYWLIQRTGLRKPKARKVHRLDMTFRELLPSFADDYTQSLLPLLNIHRDAPAISSPQWMSELSSKWLEITSSGCNLVKLVDGETDSDSDTGSDTSSRVPPDEIVRTKRTRRSRANAIEEQQG